MAKTRSAKPAASKKKEEPQSTTKSTVKKLEASVDTPPQVFILPKDASSDARIASIPNPATATPNRYFVCPEKGFYEFTRVAAPKKQHRSWLLAPDRSNAEQNATEENKDADGEAGYVLQTPDMLVATPIDPLFLLLPSLASDVNSIGQEYLAASDYLVKLTEGAPHLSQVVQPNATRKLEQTMEARIAAISDCMDMGDDNMYALSLPKLVKELVTKAKRMTATGLPASMEDRFVKQALDVPVLSIKREESSISIATDEATAGAESHTASEAQSQETNASGTTVASVSTTATSVATVKQDESSTASPKILALLRLRTALNFLLTSYISPSLRTKLEALIADTKVSTLDFAPVDERLKHIAAMKKEAHALRSLSDNISRKRSAVDDDEAAEKAETKKRKKEEEESRKKKVSQGVKKLMKADTSGMKKLSSFFAKPAAKK